MKFAVALWKETMDEGGLAWDDTSNNRAFLSGSISATNNGASIYLEAKKKPGSYLTEKGTPMKDVSFIPAFLPVLAVNTACLARKPTW